MTGNGVIVLIARARVDVGFLRLDASETSSRSYSLNDSNCVQSLTPTASVCLSVSKLVRWKSTKSAY